MSQEQKQWVGTQSIRFRDTPYIVSSACIVGKKEGEGPLGEGFDMIEVDEFFGKATWEEAESEMQKIVCETALQKGRISADEIRYLFGGDLLRQGIATSMGVEDLQIPLFGLFGACSTSGEALALGAMTIAGGYADYVMAVTSSHFGSAEKEFRFPLLYANQRPLSTQWTVTGSGAFVVGSQKQQVQISAITVGKIVNYGLKDAQNMGACMAPAAADTIRTNLLDFAVREAEYTKIITGDLGEIGSEILIELLRKNQIEIEDRHLDCGMLIYDGEHQGTHAGGSGCGCAAVTLSSYILPKLQTGEWKKVLFVPTGALLSTVSFNEGNSIPAIAHAIVLEHNPM